MKIFKISNKKHKVKLISTISFQKKETTMWENLTVRKNSKKVSIAKVGQEQLNIFLTCLFNSIIPINYILQSSFEILLF